MGEMLRLRVVHGKENYDVDMASTSTPVELQSRLEGMSGLPASEQRLIHRGRVISGGSAPSDGTPAIHTRSLADLGVAHRDRLHLSADPRAAEARHRRQGQLRVVSEVALALDALETRIDASTRPGAWDLERDLRTYEELLTRQVLALDAIDGGSAPGGLDADARAQRKDQIRRAEALSKRVQDHHAHALRSAEDGTIGEASDDESNEVAHNR